MEMMNRAIEDAADFKGFRDKLMQRNPNAMERPPIEGENRTQRRARERAERKAASKAQPKVRT